MVGAIQEAEKGDPIVPAPGIDEARASKIACEAAGAVVLRRRQGRRQM
jgi:hypothetical protein